MLPLMAPAIAAFAIFQFLWVWNDLLVALVFAGGNPEVSPLTVRLAALAGQRGEDWHLLSAGAFVSLVDPAGRLPVAAALLRPRPARGQRQGMSRWAASACRAGAAHCSLSQWYDALGVRVRSGEERSTWTRPNFLA